MIEFPVHCGSEADKLKMIGWKAANNGVGKRPRSLMWFVMHHEKKLYNITSTGNLHRYGSHTAAQKVADKLNTMDFCLPLSEGDAKLFVVEVPRIGIYICQGTFLYKSKGAKGWWLSMTYTGRKYNFPVHCGSEADKLREMKMSEQPDPVCCCGKTSEGLCPRCGQKMGSEKLVWSEEWPTKEGMYWFYGWRSEFWDQQPKLRVVKVQHTGQDTKPYPTYICDGAFLYKSEGANGLWLSIDMPQLPEEELRELK